jgi:hypothetical protein
VLQERSNIHPVTVARAQKLNEMEDLADSVGAVASDMVPLHLFLVGNLLDIFW